jgi:hypothetical protein
MRAILILAAAALSAASAAALARVDYGPGQDIAGLAPLGVPVVFSLEGGCLVLVEHAEAAGLACAGWRCTVLDRETRGRRYVYAAFEPGDDRASVAAFGEVLTEDAGGVVLATDESGIAALPGLGCELAAISLRPLVLTTSVPNPEPAALPDSLVWEIVNRVRSDTLEAWLRRLVGFYTRYTSHDSCRSAVSWLGQRLDEYGCDTVIYDDYQSGYAPQVIGVKHGTVNPRRIYVVCGHVDDYSEMVPGGWAPGSEDNASGTGCMLECARVTADLDFDYTVWFIAWTGEEQGLVGSADYIGRCRSRGDSIVLGMNFDMVSYGPLNRDSIRVVGKRANPPCSTWVEFYRAQADTYTTLKHLRYMVNDQQTSDHASFWNNGYTCIRGGYNVRTSVYHTTGDTIGPLYYEGCGTNNIPMYTEVVKATVATLAKLAGAHHAVGIAEPDAGNGRRMTGPTIIGGSLNVPPGSRVRCSLYDLAGREVLGLVPGANDIRRLGPGVYLVRSTSGRESDVGRVVIAE